MNHDPLCPLNDEQWLKHPLEKCYYCELIAAVREDERTRHQGQSVMLASDAEAAIAAARADMLAKCIAELEALMAKTDGDRFHGFWDFIAALRALEDKP